MLSIAVMVATLMQVLDTTIANVALPHMQAALGASQDSVAWVLTSYIVTAAIATPVTGWLEARIGRRKLFTVAIVGFTLSSILCGISISLGMMVISRALQGMFGAFISPLSQAVMLDSYPPEKRAQAMMIWGMGVMVGPIMGPVLGGWLTDQFDWRWVFFINVPFGIACAVGLWLLMDERGLPKRRFDMIGFVLLAIALACFQIMLDRGTQENWSTRWRS
jgi:DHA2 family multidrug resistance protein